MPHTTPKPSRIPGPLHKAGLFVLFAAITAALCLLLSGCAATGTTSPQRYSVTWWDVFDTVTVISGYADSEADWNTQITALHADLLRYNQLYDI